MSLNAQVLGGYRDGEVVPFVGPYLVLPAAPVRSFVTSEATSDRLPSVATFAKEFYVPE